MVGRTVGLEVTAVGRGVGAAGHTQTTCRGRRKRRRQEFSRRVLESLFTQSAHPPGWYGCLLPAVGRPEGTVVGMAVGRGVASTVGRGVGLVVGCGVGALPSP